MALGTNSALIAGGGGPGCGFGGRRDFSCEAKDRGFRHRLLQENESYWARHGNTNRGSVASFTGLGSLADLMLEAMKRVVLSALLAVMVLMAPP